MDIRCCQVLVGVVHIFYYGCHFWNKQGFCGSKVLTQGEQNNRRSNTIQCNKPTVHQCESVSVWFYLKLSDVFFSKSVFIFEILWDVIGDLTRYPLLSVVEVVLVSSCCLCECSFRISETILFATVHTFAAFTTKAPLPLCRNEQEAESHVWRSQLKWGIVSFLTTFVFVRGHCYVRCFCYFVCTLDKWMLLLLMVM